MLHVRLVQEFGVSPAVAQHLAKAYGGRARELLSIRVADSISNGDQPNPLHDLLVAECPYIEAEVIFSTRYEWAVHAGVQREKNHHNILYIYYIYICNTTLIILSYMATSFGCTEVFFSS